MTRMYNDNDDDDTRASGGNPETTPRTGTTPAGAEGGTTASRTVAAGNALGLASYLHSVDGGEVGGGADRAEERLRQMEEKLLEAYRRMMEMSDRILRME